MKMCAVYKSSKKQETYLFVEKRDDFSRVPDALLDTFGAPLFVMMVVFNEKLSLALADKQKVIQALQQQGYYLQMPPPQENLLKVHLSEQQGRNV